MPLAVAHSCRNFIHQWPLALASSAVVPSSASSARFFHRAFVVPSFRPWRRISFQHHAIYLRRQQPSGCRHNGQAEQQQNRQSESVISALDSCRFIFVFQTKPFRALPFRSFQIALSLCLFSSARHQLWLSFFGLAKDFRPWPYPCIGSLEPCLDSALPCLVSSSLDLLPAAARRPPCPPFVAMPCLQLSVALCQPC